MKWNVLLASLIALGASRSALCVLCVLSALVLDFDRFPRALQMRQKVILLDVRTDVFAYLKGHLPGAEYLNSETSAPARAASRLAFSRRSRTRRSSPGWGWPSTYRW